MYRIIIGIATLVVILALATPTPLTAATVKIEAESYTDSNDIGYVPIQISPEATCSGGQMVIGFDCFDEWIEFDTEVSVEGDYEVYVHCRGDIGAVYWFQFSLVPKIPGQGYEFTLNYVGKGYG